MPELIKTWSNAPPQEDSMTDEHAWIWREMINCIPNGDLSGARVLDIGCNQGRFLRQLYDAKSFASAVGIDIAEDRIALANEAKESRPIEYIATPDLKDAGDNFDLAFSHEVIYLIQDLEDHARQVASSLKQGGHYDAVTCCHANNPLYTEKWRPMIQEFSNVAVPNHSIDDIVEAFQSAGLQVFISRFLARAFIPHQTKSAFIPTEVVRLETYTNWKICFRCFNPA